MKTMTLSLSVAIFVAVFFYGIANADDIIVYNQLIAEFRHDKANIKNSQGYAIQIATGTNLPNLQWPSFTAGWIAIELQPRAGADCGGTFSCEFSQVGIMSTSRGIRWFVYAEPGVKCYRGNPAWVTDKTRGCIGNIGDLIQPSTLHMFDLQTYDSTPYWLAHVYDANKQMYYVAKILTNDRVAYRIYSASEQAWDKTELQQNPFANLDYQYYRPQRKRTNGSGTFRDWEVSIAPNYNFTFAKASDGENICPPVGPYGFWIYANTPPMWYAGTSGQNCNLRPLF